MTLKELDSHPHYTVPLARNSQSPDANIKEASQHPPRECDSKTRRDLVPVPPPSVSKPIPNEVSRLQTGLWLSPAPSKMNVLQTRWAQRLVPASVFHSAFPHSHGRPSSFFIDKILEDRFFPQLPSTKCGWCRFSTAIKTACKNVSIATYYLPHRTCFRMGKWLIHSLCLVPLPIFSLRDILTAHV